MAASTLLLVTYVEDERVMYGQALDRAGFRVLSPDSPDDAFTRAVRVQPAAIITRILQPGHSTTGLDLLRRLKQHEDTSHIPVVIITSLIQAPHRAEATAAGCDGYLLLPTVPDRLVDEVHRLLDQARRRASGQ